ncbi:hypothetical protein GCM10009077_11260 [Roseibium denhamense]
MLAARLAPGTSAYGMTMTHLTVNWSSDGSVLTGIYEFANGAQNPAIVFDMLFKEAPSGQRILEPGLAFTQLLDNGILVADKLIPALPEDLDVDAPIIPYGRVVGPGTTLSGHIRLPLPVPHYQPYDYQKPDVEEVIAQGVSMRLGYALIDEAYAGKALELDGVEVQSVRHGWAAPRQKFVNSEVVQMQIPCFRPGS